MPVAVIGQAASLQMIDAGPLVRYQHYPAVTTLASTHPWLLALVALQTVIVSTALAKRMSGRLVAGVERLAARRLVAAILLSVCTVATVSPSVVRYLGELAFASYLQVLSIATIVLMVLALPQGSLAESERRLTRILGPEDDERRGEAGRRDRFGWTAAAVATLLAVALNIFSYERHPHIADEVVYLYHARYLAAGMLTMPAPPSVAAFDVDLMSYEPTRWFSPLSPGWPAMLAVGVFAGLPWLVTPVLAGLNILLTYMLLGELYSRRLARYAGIEMPRCALRCCARIRTAASGSWTVHRSPGRGIASLEGRWLRPHSWPPKRRDDASEPGSCSPPCSSA